MIWVVVDQVDHVRECGARVEDTDPITTRPSVVKKKHKMEIRHRKNRNSTRTAM
jgi:hypothetical protein